MKAADAIKTFALKKRLPKSLQLFSVSLFLVFGKVKSQPQDSIENDPVITNLEWRGGVYIQEGRHSAVTGGIGTEKLQVYSNGFGLNHKYKNRNSINLNGGIDIISSESTDNIDFNVSSASAKDAHVYVNFDFTKAFDKSETYFSFGSGGSIESDYLSIPIRIALNHTSPDRSKSFYIGIERYFDDLRWGRLDEDYKRPALLVYPKELRDTEWLDENWRYTTNLNYGFSAVVNKRLVAGLSGIISYQNGLLSTPFHRVYFKDGSKRVEFLPSSRLKIPITFQANYFAGSNQILKTELGFSYDDFGIFSQSVYFEWVQNANPTNAVKAFFRIQNQSASRYFQPFGEHELDSEFYTSDYDLSAFQTYKLGLGWRSFVQKGKSKKWTLDELEWRYAVYYRTDGLTAHILTLKTGIGWKRNPKSKNKK